MSSCMVIKFREFMYFNEIYNFFAKKSFVSDDLKIKYLIGAFLFNLKKIKDMEGDQHGR